MVSKLGISSILIGLFVGLFSMISTFMSADNIWVGITLSTLSEDLAQTIVEAFSVEWMNDAVYTLFYEIPLGGVLLGLGVIILGLSLFIREH